MWKMLSNGDQPLSMDIDLYINDAGEGHAGNGIAYFGIFFYNVDKTLAYSYAFEKQGTLGDTPNVIHDGDNIHYTSNFTSDYFNKNEEALTSDYYLRFYSTADYAEYGSGTTKAETTLDLAKIRKYSETSIIPSVGNEENNPLIYIADFTCSPQFGYSPLDVNFTDLSQGIITTWEWDFDNDGIVDAFDQNPTHTYSNEGLYDVELKVSGPNGTDSLLRQNCILVQSVELAPPTNPTIETSDNDIILSWDDVSVDYYLIYSNDKPDGIFTYLDNVSGITTYTHTGILLEKDKLFYVIIGFNGGLEKLERFINHNQKRNFNIEIK